ncbi:MAG: hypothetical protein FJ388_10675 [Verrucomicrobia bacterium]|nr:hypothetical protein [Verrucomicrobiota bacterium]
MKARLPKATQKQRRYAAARVSGQSQQQAARSAGYRHPHEHCARIEAADGTRRAIEELCARANLPDDHAARRFREAFDAEKFTRENGANVSLGPDHAARWRALEVWLKCKGYLSDTAEVEMVLAESARRFGEFLRSINFCAACREAIEWRYAEMTRGH